MNSPILTTSIEVSLCLSIYSSMEIWTTISHSQNFSCACMWCACICVNVHKCVWVCMYMRAHVCGRQKWKPGLFFFFSPLCFWRQHSLLNPELANSASLTRQLTLGIPSLLLEITWKASCLFSFYVVSGHLNSNSLACKASVLSIEPLFLPTVWWIYG